MSAIIKLGDELFDELEGAWAITGEPAIVTLGELRYRRIKNNEVISYIELDRRERDSADPTGRWTMYYGPTNVREEM